MASRAPEEQRPKVVRLTFSYDESGIHLLDRQVITKRIEPGEALSAPPPADTVSAELRTAGGVPKFRRAIPDAIPRDVEVFDPEHGIRREPTPPSSGVFTVLVPEDEEADEVVLIAGRAALPSSLAVARETSREPTVIARFAFRPEGR